ncbi:4-hydroxy-tetrahydrodipicolinate reductase [Flavobacteriaceae bacterium F08102]|nr:4-hydroxy-tetrahydrodipicolinate reductase [Flavobacteriaceae bacterium F08102]
MNIALFGYGRMGQAIEKIAISRKHSIVAIFDKSQDEYNLSNVDVAIDFSMPNVAYANITTCLNQGVPVISGTTGWLTQFDEVVELCKEKQGAFIYASNFSLGVNLFFALNTKLAEMMSAFPDYSVSLEEIHHTKKLDAPSGTAISLANDIINVSSKESWTLDETNDPKKLPITSKRIGDVPGTHTVTYQSDVDEIEIKHQANNRSGFAFGAVIAAEWILNKKGVFTMKDVLGI